ncbi:putative methyltransferase-like protein 24 [Saccoglossus kowalevskii]
MVAMKKTIILCTLCLTVIIVSFNLGKTWQQYEDDHYRLPSPQRRENNVEASKMNINHTDKNEVWGSLLKYVTTQEYTCKNMKRMGYAAPRDGGWFICMDVHIDSNSCIVYSVGIANNWSFDDDMAEFGCKVYSFDPSIGQPDHKHAENVWFYNIGLWDENIDNMTTNKGVWKCRTLDSLRKFLGHDTVDVLKIDIEGSEWSVFVEILKSGVLNKVKQIMFELHVGGIPVNRGASDGMKKYKLLHQLLAGNGFKLFYSADNSLKTKVSWGDLVEEHANNIEMGFVNSKYM